MPVIRSKILCEFQVIQDIYQFVGNREVEIVKAAESMAKAEKLLSIIKIYEAGLCRALNSRLIILIFI